MKELTVGEISNKELADWFGIKEATFKNAKAKKLQELKYFADFYEEKREGICYSSAHCRI